MSTGARKVSLSLPEIRVNIDDETTSLSCWQRWRGRVVTLVGVSGTLASLAVRIGNFSNWSNAVASLGIGAGVQHLIESLAPSQPLQIIRHLTMSMLGGQSTFFFATELYENIDLKSLDDAATTVAVITLGANLCMFAKWLWENHFLIRTEIGREPLLGTDQGKTFHGIFLNPIPKDLLRMAVIVSASLGAAFSGDKVARTLLGGVATYYSSQIVGDRLINYADKKITQKDEEESSLTFTEKKGSRWKVVKTSLNSTGFIAIPMFLIPFSAAAHTSERVEQLIFDAAGIGFFDAVMHQSFENRLKSVPVKKLKELQLCDTESRAYRIWSVAFPAIVGTGLFAFGIWQIGWDLSNSDQREAMGFLLIGFTLASGSANLVDRFLWKRDQRIEQGDFLQSYRRKRKTTWKEDLRAFKIYALDKFFITLLLTQRVFGISPAIVLSFITNAVAMNDRALEKESNINKAIVKLGWFSYGFAWGLELVRTGGKRRGAEYQLVLLVVINGVLTFIRVGEGDV